MISKIVIIVVNDSTLQSSESISSSSIDIGDTVNKKDERLELVDISKGFLNLNGFIFIILVSSIQIRISTPYTYIINY
jgi:hypothetical protein